MDRILFLPDGHKYIQESSGLQLMSVSHFRKLFDGTDWVHNVRKSAAKTYLKDTAYKKLKTAWENNGRNILEPDFITYLLDHMDKKTFERVCKETRAEWDERGRKAAALGTIEHDREEKKAITDGFSINAYNGLEYPTQPHGKMPDGSCSTTVERLCELEPGFYPELMLWHLFPEPIFSQSMKTDIIGVCGTSDKVFIEPDRGYIRDFKFPSEKITDFPITYKNFGREYHLDPWGDWYTTKISGYRQQLNIYGWMMEQHGLPPESLHLDIRSLDGKQNEEIYVPYEGWRVGRAMDKIFLDCL